MSQADSRKAAKSSCFTPDTAAGAAGGWEERGLGKKGQQGPSSCLQLPPRRSVQGLIRLLVCFYFHFSFSHPPEIQEATAPPPASGPACPSPPCPLYLGRPPLVHGPAGLPLSPPERTEGGTAEEAAASCRLGSPPRRRRGWCGGGGALTSQSSWPAGRGQGRGGLDLPSREAGAPRRVPRRRAGCSPGPPQFPDRPRSGHPAPSG